MLWSKRVFFNQQANDNCYTGHRQTSIRVDCRHCDSSRSEYRWACTTHSRGIVRSPLSYADPSTEAAHGVMIETANGPSPFPW